MIDPSIVSDRRRRYLQQTGRAVTVLFSAPVASRNSDVEYEYRPDADFYYLTGFNEPESVAVLSPDADGWRFTLFVRPRDPAREVWDGLRAGVEGALARHGADVAYPIEKLDEELPKLLENVPEIFHRLGRSESDDARVHAAIRRARAQVKSCFTWPTTFRDPSELIAEMRLLKQEADLGCLRRAVELTCEGHREAMRAAAPGRWEYEVEAVIEFTFRRRGAESWGYPTICGSGPNSCILHYIENSRRMEAGELLLVDAGAELELYTGDCTRTFPVDGRFTPEQRALYGLCLDAQKEAIRAAVPGARFADVHRTSVEVIVHGLVELGLLAGPVDEAIEKETYKSLFMHKTSHWLGMDVHDAGRYRDQAGDSRPLEPGMVLTVEPGIYVAAQSAGIDPKWWNIGIRIEDDLLITPSGNEVLTAAVPKEIPDVEQLCAQPSALLD
ncbi:MAG: aminopeptidase P N-terminal domain-containing protein [Candidatus Wallbacteria bacterium]|nr:aminopeptidase P N-terminal domain-containing protein [Candidatus Wallbacteria bacterium]